MTTELISGSPESLKARLDTIILGGGTIEMVVPTHSKTTYLIMWS